MNPLLPSQISQLLPTDGSGERNQTKIIQNGQLVFTGRVLVFKNTIYYLRNITSIRFSDNTKILTKKLPVWYWAILVLGIVTIAMVVGVFLIIWFFWLVYNHFQNRVQVKEEYGMIIEMNSGSSSVLLGSQKEFILEVIYDLYEILNAEESQPMLFDFSHNVMNDSSINVREAVNAALISGKVIGGVNTQSS
ncbi:MULTISPECIES: DUF6232 family protein [unclassified Microcoleus]|uniref:DUF6232 family protein n=1 Tax=unclassified Microcoleus TaxID=2642155 RepID=UPI001DA2D4B8|nr:MULTISPECIES: DUF6232 family protein [unclassified Microcoleus]MCC3600081.1 hypothetical protein [Microcoleus sp. PH2017_26_ELK_O_A]MCC3625063.1 hypothetical protein [Microcoleus sp. PH2017_36_ELK_O_B]